MGKNLATSTYPIQMPKTILITGCSSGFGFLSALEFAGRGYKVFATMRNPESLGGKKLKEIAQDKKLDLSVMQLDVKDELDVKTVVNSISNNNPIDILVNNAAYGYISTIEDIDITKFTEQIETNLLGAVRLIKAVLPQMKARKSGKIINLGSILSFINIPKYGPYSSTKHALESLSLTADMELAKYNVRSIMVDPGSFPTNFSKNKVDNASALNEKTFDYDKLVNSKSTYVSRLIFKIAEMETPNPKYLAGADSRFGALLEKVLPTSTFYKLLNYYTSNFKKD